MPQASFDSDANEHVEHHRDGSVRASGPLKDGSESTALACGPGSSPGEQVGEWTTYDRAGAPYKVTSMGDRTQG